MGRDGDTRKLMNPHKDNRDSRNESYDSINIDSSMWTKSGFALVMFHVDVYSILLVRRWNTQNAIQFRLGT
jgi:hypothetical protein